MKRQSVCWVSLFLAVALLSACSSSASKPLVVSASPTPCADLQSGSTTSSESPLMVSPLPFPPTFTPDQIATHEAAMQQANPGAPTTGVVTATATAMAVVPCPTPQASRDNATPSSATALGGGSANANQNGEAPNNLPGAAAVDARAGQAGTAVTSDTGFVDGSGQGFASPPDASALAAQHAASEVENEKEIDPLTPIDPKAVLRSGPPNVPMTEVQTGPASPSSPSAASDFLFYRKTDLGAGTSSLIGEASHASDKNVVLETWNWYAAISKDAGSSWTYYDPSTFFPASYGGFCCDQVVYYDQSHDMTIWILQYSTNVSKTDGIR